MRRLAGQTLIELLVALGVMSVGLFAAIALVYSNLGLVERDTDEVIVVNLAREGIELVKQARDTNWLNGAAFDVGLVNPSDAHDFTATPVWDGVVAQPTFAFTANDFTDSAVNIVLAGPTSTRMYANQNVTADITGIATPFQRLLTLHPICVDAANTETVLNTGSCEETPGLSKIGIRIESHVHWTRRSIAKDFVMYDDIYDWK